jgi:branched-chain amino acid transport system ATP-binding protein
MAARIGANKMPRSENAPQPVPLLEVEGLAFDYGGVQAVQDCSFDVADGGITALIGGNGAGKSTSVLAVSGARRARKGRIRFDGERA